MKTTPLFGGTVIETLDGSNSLKHCQLNDSYHSLNGALEESEHIYINCGLKNCNKTSVTLFEMGFGTGLNMLLSLDYALKNNICIDYHTVEKFPLNSETIKALHFENLCSTEVYSLFLKCHNCNWDEKVEISPNFSLTKYYSDITTFTNHPDGIDLIYFDAFAPDTQPDLWSEEVFRRIYNKMNPNSILMTYSSKGDVKRALRSAGFEVKRLAGVGGKRHIVRATKLSQK